MIRLLARSTAAPRSRSRCTKTDLVREVLTKTYPANFFEQVSANSYLGLTLGASDTITFTVNSGGAIVYGAQTDNKNAF